MSDSNNLPVFVQQVGGSLAEVLAWPHHLKVLSISQKANISMIVDQNPSLNTERCVDMLADLAGVYKERLGPWFNLLVEESGLEDVHLAVEALYELGVCSVGEMQTMKERDQTSHPLELMLALMDRLRLVPHHFTEVEELAHLIERLGGWAEACNLHNDPTLSQDELSRGPDVELDDDGGLNQNEL